MMTTDPSADLAAETQAQLLKERKQKTIAEFTAMQSDVVSSIFPMVITYTILLVLQHYHDMMVAVCYEKPELSQEVSTVPDGFSYTMAAIDEVECQTLQNAWVVAIYLALHIFYLWAFVVVSVISAVVLKKLPDSFPRQAFWFATFAFFTANAVGGCYIRGEFEKLEGTVKKRGGRLSELHGRIDEQVAKIKIVLYFVVAVEYLFILNVFHVVSTA